MNQLDQLKQFTTVVADTGDFGTIAEYGARDATTNPTLILKAAQMPQYAGMVRGVSTDELLVAFGCEVLAVVPGRVSTETDAALAFDTAGIIAHAKRLIKLYEARGIGRERILIKIAATWEGIRAAEILEKEGIHCNMTLLFSLAQAVAAAEANATLISPFVGRILDWYRTKEGREYEPAEDPGVLSATAIYNYYKRFGLTTEVMGASFRNVGEIRELVGCDLLTIAPKFLAELKASDAPLERKLSPEKAKGLAIDTIAMDEVRFRSLMEEDTMASEKLAEGIRIFVADGEALGRFVADL